MARVTNAWAIGPYVFSEIEDHGFKDFEGEPLYQFTIEGRRAGHTAYQTLDEALVSAVGERWTGPQSAGGGGVDTAAGWFLRMIGAAGHHLPEGVRVEIGKSTSPLAYEIHGPTDITIKGEPA